MSPGGSDVFRNYDLARTCGSKIELSISLNICPLTQSDFDMRDVLGRYALSQNAVEPVAIMTSTLLRPRHRSK